MGARLVSLVAPRKGVRRVDRGLALKPPGLGERLGENAGWNGDKHNVGVRGVAAVASKRGDGVACSLPLPRQATADRAPADGDDIYGSAKTSRPKVLAGSRPAPRPPDDRLLEV